MSPLEPFRWIVGQGVLAYELLTRKKPVERPTEQQAAIDESTKGLSLYEFRSCPFCMKVRKITHHKNLNIELRDARRNERWKQELINEGGKFQVPCLRMKDENGKDIWMYESSNIIDHLNKHYPTEES